MNQCITFGVVKKVKDEKIVTLSSYNELYDLIINSKLVPGLNYRFPYKSVNFLQGQRTVSNYWKAPMIYNDQSDEFKNNISDIHVGEIEMFVVKAISSFQLSPFVFSENYPQDLIEYSPYVNKLGVDVNIYSNANISGEIIEDFNLQFDEEKQQVFFQMPNNFPINFGHYLYIYSEFQREIKTPKTGGSIMEFEDFRTIVTSNSNNFGGINDSETITCAKKNPGSIILPQDLNYTTNGNGKDAKLIISYDGTSIKINVKEHDHGVPFKYCGNSFLPGDEIYFNFDGESYIVQLTYDNVLYDTGCFVVAPISTNGEGKNSLFHVTAKRAYDTGKIVVGYFINLVLQKGEWYVYREICKVPGSLLNGNDGDDDFYFSIGQAKDIVPGEIIIEEYYQDGTFEPVLPGIQNCQYPYTSDDPEFGYGKAMSRIEVSKDNYRVYLIDLNFDDYVNYIANTLSVNHVKGIVDSFGYIIRREDTSAKITMPFDWRNFMYRRWLKEIETNNYFLNEDYYMITSNDYIHNSVGPVIYSKTYKDLPILVKGNSYTNINIEGTGGPNNGNFELGLTANLVFNTEVRNLHFNAGVLNSTFFYINSTTFKNFVFNVIFDRNSEITNCSFIFPHTNGLIIQGEHFSAEFVLNDNVELFKKYVDYMGNLIIDKIES